MEKPTLKSLSKQLGFDPSLISRILRGAADARVSDANRQLILQAAKKAGYYPNRIGRSLRSRTSNVVALLTPDITNPFHSLLFRGAEATARNAGYEIILCHVADVRKSGELIEAVTRGLVDGVLVACAWQPDPRLATLKSAGLPYVVINRPSGEHAEMQFVPDDNAVGVTAAKTLINLGHRKIIAVFSDMRMGSMRLRRDAFVRTAKALDPHCEVTIKEEINNIAKFRILLDSIMAEPPHARPSAIFTAHSQYARVAVEEATLRHHIHIPDALSILGCGAAMDSIISSVCVPAEAIGIDGMLALLDLIAGEADSHGTVYEPVLNAGLTLSKWPLSNSLV